MTVIYFVVVQYNNFNYTRSLIDTLLKQNGTGKLFQVKCIVVDNSNNADDRKIQDEYFQSTNCVEVVQCLNNPGYFGGLNRGLSCIEDKVGSFVVIGNNDLEFDGDFCKRLLASQYASNVHVVCPDVVTLAGRHQNPYVPERISVLKRLRLDLYLSHYYLYLFHYYLAALLSGVKSRLDKAIGSNHNSIYPAAEIHMGIGACYIMMPSFFKHSSSLDCPIFLYGEEAFISKQVHINGGVLYFDPCLKVLHAESAALSKLPKRKTYQYAKEGYPLYRHLL